MVAVQRSTASGAVQRVETVAVDGGRRTVEVPISIQRFADGGWLPFDLLSGAGNLVLHQADWMAPALDREAGRATLEITTMNKPSSARRTWPSWRSTPSCWSGSTTRCSSSTRATNSSRTTRASRPPPRHWAVS